VIVERLTRSRSTARRIASDPYMHDPTLAERAAVLVAAEIPVHLVWGENDGIVPVSYLESWRAAFPHADSTVISRAGHLPHVEHADEFLTATGLLGEPAGSSTSENEQSWN
jgi:pimeloyl-ACP methyl ester carboxylesterase